MHVSVSWLDADGNLKSDLEILRTSFQYYNPQLIWLFNHQKSNLQRGQAQFTPIFGCLQRFESVKMAKNITYFNAYVLKGQSFCCLIFILSLNQYVWLRRLFRAHLTHDCSNPSTSNLVRHILRCLGRPTDAKFAVTLYSVEGFRYTICEWVSHDNHAFSIVSSPYFGEQQFSTINCTWLMHF